MKIKLEIAKNLLTQSLLRQKDIPCRCRIRGLEFEISFIDPLPVAHGRVSDWDPKKLDERAPAYGGGNYTHDCFGEISLVLIEGDEDEYEIVDLSFFNRAVGWCPIIVNREYGPVGSFWDEEE